MDKKRQQMNRRIALEKLASAKTMRYQGKESPLFDDSDLKIDHPKAISEGGKHYLNMLSELDNIDPYKEYIEAGQGKCSKASDASSSLMNDDEYDDFVENFIRKPSRLDKKYRELDVNAKPDREDKREDIWDNVDFLLPDSDNHIPIMAEEKPPIPVIQARAHPARNNQNKDEQTDLAYAIAEDFATKENLIIVGGNDL